jgi:hypothetical protein
MPADLPVAPGTTFIGDPGVLAPRGVAVSAGRT